MLNRLTDSLDFQGQALQLRSERQRLIASNIANADTPGYQARDMDFAQALRQATGALHASPLLATSQPGHLGEGRTRKEEARGGEAKFANRRRDRSERRSDAVCFAISDQYAGRRHS